MTKVNDIIRIKEEIIFGGAIQADWYYDNRGEVAAKNFVFHGPNYFGVLDNEVEFMSHKLIDTCSLVENITKKLVGDEGNPITLSIAGYGTGKSHLAVTMAKLFSDPNSDLSRLIINNIAIADAKISSTINKSLNKPNFCIVLNGMKDFNLNYEIINNIKKSLKELGYDDCFLSEFTKAYSIAATFVERNFERFSKEFSELASNRGISVENLKLHILDNVYKDDIFDLINEMYKEVTGEYIRWDEGVTAAEVIKKLSEKLCGENLPFNKIIIFFDEFGRYLEYVSAYPTRAGDAALQQIYDVVTSSENNILLISFIQSDLKTYLARVSKSSNVSRYIGRYESGEKLYLSSNIETIFANIIEKYDFTAFQHFVKGYFNNNDVNDRYDRLFENLCKWTVNAKKRGLWSDKDKFKKVIVEGIYPFHPLTTYLLTALSDWYQQRSAIQFLISSFKAIENKPISELGDLPQVYAIDLLKGDLFKELLLAEEEGRQKSEYCSVYDKVIAKYDEKLSIFNKDILTAVLALKLLRFRVNVKDELLLLIQSITGYAVKAIRSSIDELENDLGILSYDEKNCTYDFIEDATGINDFNRFIRKKRQEILLPLNVMINESVLEKMGISQLIKPDFTLKNNIKTSEWQFEQQLVPIDNVNSEYIDSFIKEFNKKTSVDKAKGRIVYVYYNNDYDYCYIDKLNKLCSEYNLNKYPIVFTFLDDKDKNLEDAIIANTLINKFTPEEKMKFSKFITKFINDNDEVLKDKFRDLMMDKQIVINGELKVVGQRISLYCNSVLEKLYPYVISFPFDGFDAKTITNAKKYYLNICNWLLSSGSVNEQGFHLLPKEVKNRVSTVLINTTIGWGGLNDKFEVVYPINSKVKKLFDEIDEEFMARLEINIDKYYNKYTKSPYGLNDYSFTLFVMLYLIYKGNVAKVILHDSKLKLQEWAVSIFNDKGINLISLKETKVIKVEVEGYLLKYIDMCERIEKNNDISLFENLFLEIKDLIKESDPPEDLASRIDGAKIRAEQGKRTFDKKEKDIAQLKGLLEKSIEEEDYKNLIRTINNSNGILSENDEVSGFKITYRQEGELNKILSRAHKYIEINYTQFIKKVDCTNIAQLTAFEKWMKALRDDLRSLNYDAFANATHNRLNEVINNVDKLKEIQLAIESTNNFLKLNKPTSYTGQEELFNWQDAATRLVEYVSANLFIDKYRKKELVDKLQLRMKEIKKCLEEINKSISEIIDGAYGLEQVSDCANLLNSIELVLAKKLREKDKVDIVDIGNVLHDFMAEIKNIEDEKNLLYKRKKLGFTLEKYSDDDIVDLKNVIQNYIDEVDERLKNLNDSWCKKNLTMTNSQISEWDSSLCTQWITRTDDIPYYLNADNVTKYKDIYRVVIERRKQLKIESIVDIFNALEEDEKRLCIERLEKIQSDFICKNILNKKITKKE